MSKVILVFCLSNVRTSRAQTTQPRKLRTMSDVRITPSTPKPKRRTVRIQSTFSKNNAALDFPSNLAVLWIDKWIAEQGGPKFPHSAIVRRALAVFVAELEATVDRRAIQSVLRNVETAAFGTRLKVDEMDTATKRLHEAPLKPFKVVLKGQYQVDQDKALLTHLDDVAARLDAGTYR